MSRPLQQMHLRPTLGQMVRVFRGMFQDLRFLFLDDFVFCFGMNKSSLGISFADRHSYRIDLRSCVRFETAGASVHQPLANP